jgi:hypothetical protein
MKTLIVMCSTVASAAVLLCGCGNSKTDSSTPAANQAPATPPAPEVTNASAATAAAAAAPVAAAPEAATPAASAGPVTAPAVPAPATAAPAATAPSAGGTAQFLATAQSQADTNLTSLGSQLAEKTQALAQSAGGNDAVKTQVDSSMKSLAAGNDSGGLSGLFQAAKSANLTPQQTQLAKEVGNIASAYVVQKNFASVAGAQSDVATIVNSLRQGQVTPAVPALQRVAQNASLTPQQKQLVGSIADQYAPGLSKAAGTLEQGVQSLRNLGK